MRERAETNASRPQRMRDTELATYGTGIANLATANLQAGAAFGLVQQNITDLTARQHTLQQSARRKAVSRNGARTSLNELFDQADELLQNECDSYIELLRTNEPEFCTMYSAAPSRMSACSTGRTAPCSHGQHIFSSPNGRNRQGCLHSNRKSSTKVE